MGCGSSDSDSNNGEVTSITISTANNTAAADGITTISINAKITAKGQTSTTSTNTTSSLLGEEAASNPLKGIIIEFSTTSGVLSATNLTTDETGTATIIITAPTQSSTATITAKSGGFSATVEISFTSGTPAPGNSSITASPSTLAADGTSTTAVTVTLVDANGNMVADKTKVTLSATTGTISSANPSQTSQGKAVFTITAPETTGTATLSLVEYSSISGSITFGSTSSGTPATILITVTDPSVYVAGVGQSETTNINIQVLDDAGDPIKENNLYNSDFNNLRVTLVTSINNGEYVAGTNAAGGIVNTSTGAILIRTTDGSTTLNFQSGQTSGIIEVKVEALNAAGATLATALASQITIASGPAHTVNITSPNNDAITNLGGGQYCRKGTAIVTDQFGNFVPDGTAIYLGLIDSVVAEAHDGQTIQGSSTLNSASVDFSAISITRDGISRGIEENDRIIIENVPASDRNHIVDNIVDANNISSLNSYSTSSTGKQFIIGASLLGGTIGGGSSCSNLTPGMATTTQGSAMFWVKYPAHNHNNANNTGTILLGCYGYDGSNDYSTVDTRYAQPQSAQSIIVAAVNNAKATNYSKGQFCFAGMSPGTLTSTVKTIASDGLFQIPFELTDNDSDGDGIKLPFMNVSCSYIITTGTFTLTFPNGSSTTTDAYGNAIISVNISGTASGDAAQLTCIGAYETDLSINIAIP
jgi:hypothetical protein